VDTNSTLYNKYRPRKFSELIGWDQKKASDFITSSLDSGTLPQALFIHGPSGVGKTSLARLIAAALNCEDTSNAEPCGTCLGCKAIFDNEDWTLIDGSVDTGIDSMRAIISDMASPSFYIKHKVIVFDEMHNLSRQAQDSLLTAVESPPPNTTIIFCTTEARKVRKTLKTRCVQLSLDMPSYTEIVKYLLSIAKTEGVKITEKDLDSKLGSYESIRDAVCKLEIVLGGGVPGIEEEASEPSWRLLARYLAQGKIPPVDKLKTILKELRKDAGARVAIMEYLHSVILNNLGQAGSGIKIRRWRKTIETLGARDATAPPSLLTTDLLTILSELKEATQK